MYRWTGKVAHGLPQYDIDEMVYRTLVERFGEAYVAPFYVRDGAPEAPAAGGEAPSEETE